jgi:hypothetical protein
MILLTNTYPAESPANRFGCLERLGPETQRLVKKANSVAPTKAAFTRQSGTNTEIGHEVDGGISTEGTMSGGIDNRVRPVIRIVMQHLHLPLFLIAHVDVLVDGASPGALVGGAVGLLMRGGKNVITATTGFLVERQALYVPSKARSESGESSTSPSGILS